MALVGDICPFPGCSRIPSRVIEFRESKREKPNMDNSLALCSNHAEQAQRGEIEGGLLRTIRQLLRPIRSTSGRTSSRTLPTRADYLATIRDRIDAGTKSLRGVYVGPLPLHPNWYFNMRDGATSLPNMDRSVSACLEDPECETYLIFRNTIRYITKVRELLPPDNLPVLASQIARRVDQLYGSKIALNNHVVCADTGFFHIPIILDNSIITAFRPTPQTPVGSGILVTDADQVQWERSAFDRMFEYYATASPASHAELVKQFVTAALVDDGAS